MNETFSEPQLFRAYEVVFQSLLDGLMVGAVLMLVAAIVLIILCCRQLKAQTRRKEAELKTALEASLNTSNDAIEQRRACDSVDGNGDTMSRLGTNPGGFSVGYAAIMRIAISAFTVRSSGEAGSPRPCQRRRQ